MSATVTLNMIPVSLTSDSFSWSEVDNAYKFKEEWLTNFKPSLSLLLKDDSGNRKSYNIDGSEASAEGFKEIVKLLKLQHGGRSHRKSLKRHKNKKK